MSRSVRIFSRWGILLCLVLGIFLAGCGGAETSPTPDATAFPTLVPSSPTSSAVNDASTPAPDVQPTSAPAATAEAQPTSPPAPTEVPPTNAPPAAVPTDAPAAAAAPPENFFGVSTNGEILYNDQLRALAIVGGVQLVRTSVSWDAIEKNKGEYNWKGSDATLKPLFDNNLAPLVMILTNADWASNSPCGPVNDLPAFDQFIRQLATHYPQVRYWVLYNEPDNGHFPEHVAGGCFGGADINSNGKPDVQDYAEQLRIAWRAIHESNPNAQLVLGALALDNFDEATAPSGYPGGGKGGVFNAKFLPDLLQYIQANPLPNGEKYFDVASFNFYGIYGPYWQRQAQGMGVIAKANAVRKMLDDAGVDARMMVGETGEDSYTDGNDKQSENGIKLLVRGLAGNLMHMVWWTYQDFPDSASPPSNTWKYGLIDQDGKPKPMYAAYQNVSKQLTGATYVQPLAVEGGEAYLFNKGGGGIGVVWSSSDNPVTIAFSANVIQVTDMYGGSQVIADASDRDTDSTAGRIGVQVDKNPTFIQAIQ